MVESYIPDKETQWNMEKDSECDQVEQGNRETTLQIAWTRRSPISSQINGLCNIPRPQISISPNHIQSSSQKQQNQFFDKYESIQKLNSQLLRRLTSNPLRQINTQNINNTNIENIVTIRMDNISREMRNKTEISNKIHGMDMESEGNEYKNFRGKKIENDTSTEALVQHNIQEQKREDKITSSADRQIKFPQTIDKRSVSVSNGIEQSEDSRIKDEIIGRNSNSKQSSNQSTE
ncbi:MAG: hypothetical protein EZS28_048759, partial [Streblomastix strix]